MISTPIVYDLIGYFVRGEVRGDPISHTTACGRSTTSPPPTHSKSRARQISEQGTERCGSFAKGNRSTSDPTSEPDGWAVMMVSPARHACNGHHLICLCMHGCMARVHAAAGHDQGRGLIILGRKRLPAPQLLLVMPLRAKFQMAPPHLYLPPGPMSPSLPLSPLHSLSSSQGSPSCLRPCFPQVGGWLQARHRLQRQWAVSILG